MTNGTLARSKAPRLALTASALLISTAALAKESSAKQFELLNKLIQLPNPVTVGKDGSIKADAAKWTTEKESDGTELLSSKKGPESKIAAMRNSDGIESFTSFVLKPAAKGSDAKPENSTSVFFTKGKIAAYTICEDNGDKASIGRTCVTATPNLCQTLRKSEPVSADTLKELDMYEMRALATILTLRGPDHQLDNVVRSGNKLGLKSGLQTTKGQLVALSRQVQKELEPAKEKTAKNEKGDSAAKEARVPAAADDESKTRTTLEHTLPILKQACTETGFLN